MADSKVAASSVQVARPYVSAQRGDINERRTRPEDVENGGLGLELVLNPT